VIADMAHSKPPMSPPFISELARRLQGQGPALSLPLTWIEQQLADAGLNIEQVVRAGNQQQAADQVSISNSIGSLRLSGYPGLARVRRSDERGRQHVAQRPGRAYAGMNFASRDGYRHEVEAIAKACKHVGRTGCCQRDRTGALERSRAGHATTHDACRFYLIDRGRRSLEQACGARLPLACGCAVLGQSATPLLLYLGAMHAVDAAAEQPAWWCWPG
jgi:cyclic beta-1,2-glucan synthetase